MWAMAEADGIAGLELVDPGLVQVHQWRPDPGDSAPEGTVSAHGAVARKP
ncbi:MAG TPA: SAM-dependent methyltransferase [Streptosporangiaceae bacterium]|jgi:S-adenosyl methyltransferase|nr:SAM-dependent methyltransferase [Streptosporangiaceae bacterium]